jgi:hypothetical protein
VTKIGKMYSFKKNSNCFDKKAIDLQEGLSAIDKNLHYSPPQRASALQNINFFIIFLVGFPGPGSG